jgi:exo-beta-1,3-glucanase (GH17 family)
MLLHAVDVSSSPARQPPAKQSYDQGACEKYENVFSGINFSPFPSAQHPGRDPHIDRAIVIKRIQQIHRCTGHIRTFTVRHGADVTADIAAEYNLHITPGAWLSRDHQSNIEAIDTLIDTAKRHPNNIDAVIIGSENLLRNELSAAQIMDYLRYARAQFGSMPVNIGYADSHDMLKKHPEIIQEVDSVYVNFYPYWEGYSIENSIAALERNYRSLLLLTGNKPVIISETGWPSCGEVLGKAVPSPENSARYLQGFLAWAKQNKVPYFYFSAFDASWKAEDEGPQGACWGILNEMRVIKPQIDHVLQLQ